MQAECGLHVIDTKKVQRKGIETQLTEIVKLISLN